jgi:hypothetical protein
MPGAVLIVPREIGMANGHFSKPTPALFENDSRQILEKSKLFQQKGRE